MLKISYNYLLLLCLVMALTGTIGLASTDEVSLRFVHDEMGSPGDITLIGGKVEKVAGLKIVINYDHQHLSFIEIKKTKATSAFLHAVNDKTPGKLIVVMASASGISGDNIPLLTLSFKLLFPDNSDMGMLKTTQAEMMTEDLKVINTTLPVYHF